MAKYKRQTNSGYGLSTPLPGIFPAPIIGNRNPTTADRGEPGQLWVNTVAGQSWIASGSAGGLTTWVLASPGASDVDTLTGDAGGPISPVLGDIILAGGTNIGSTGAGNTITFDLDAAITLATSVTSPLYTAGAGVPLQINAPAGQDIVLQMGDAAGVNGVSFQSSTPAEVFRVDSTGVMTMAGLTVTGAFTQTGGVANIGTDAAANAINIGTGAAAKTITLGNSTGATSLVFNCGTGALNIGTNAIAHTITIGNITGATAVDVNTGTGGSTYTTTNGVFNLNTGTGNINIGADAAAKTVTIGNATGATSVVLNAGTGNVNIGANATDHTTTVGSTNGVSATTLQAGTGLLHVNGGGIVEVDSVGVLELNSSGGVIGIGNDAIAQNINIGTGGAARIITVGNATGATSVVLNVGTGNLDLGVTATAHTSRLGSTTGASATTVQCGTGAMTINGGGILDIDAVGQLQINSSGSTIDIGNDAIAQNMNIGTGAAARTVTIGNATGATSVVVNSGTGAASFAANATDHTTTIGSTTGVSSTVLQAGTAGFTITGTINDMTAKFETITGSRITFGASPLAQSSLTTGAAPTGATGDLNLLSFQNGMIMEEFVLGAGQTIIAPRMDAAGLIVSGDLTTTEGYEYNFGATRANSPHSFTIGTSPAFFLEWTFEIDDVSSMEPCYIGFRRTQANQAVGLIANYTDFVAYGPNDGISPGDCAISTQLNTGGLVNTDTNDAWADTATHTLRINVSAAGVVTFLFDGAPPTVTQAFTFDNGDVVHPFWRHEYNATVGAGDNVRWISMQVGLQ